MKIWGIHVVSPEVEKESSFELGSSEIGVSRQRFRRDHATPTTTVASAVGACREHRGAILIPADGLVG